MEAHLRNSVTPGCFQDTLSQGLELNGLSDIKLPPNPPSKAILSALREAGNVLPEERQQQAPSPPASPRPEPSTPPQLPNLQEPPSTPAKAATNTQNTSSDEDEKDVEMFLVKNI